MLSTTTFNTIYIKSGWHVLRESKPMQFIFFQFYFCNIRNCAAGKNVIKVLMISTRFHTLYFKFFFRYFSKFPFTKNKFPLRVHVCDLYKIIKYRMLLWNLIWVYKNWHHFKFIEPFKNKLLDAIKYVSFRVLLSISIIFSKKSKITTITHIITWNSLKKYIIWKMLMVEMNQKRSAQIAKL